VSYETYTTEAVVCGVMPRGEHDATIRLFTKDAGMVYARAGGIRAGQSKLRYALQDFSHTTVSLVKGRTEWRIIGAVSVGNFYYHAVDRGARASMLASMRGLRRFVQGGGAHPELFEMVVESMQSLATGKHENLGEQVFLLRLLHQLGYVAPAHAYDPIVSSKTLAEACMHCSAQEHISGLVKEAVAQALLVSHL